MILIVGNNRDDLLYFETIINSKKEEVVLGRYPIISGYISNQPVILLRNVYTNVVSSMICSYLIEKKYVLFIVKVGKVTTLSKNFRNGDIVVSRKILGFDVDVTDIRGIKLGQIPNYPDSYSTANEIRSMLLNSFARRSQSIAKDCLVCSSNTHFVDPKQLESFIVDDKILDNDINSIVFDTESFGIAVAATTHDIPVVSIGVVINHIGEEFDPSVYIKTLSQYTNIGKSVCNLISEVGSSDVERGR